jgi:hypothetical protein
MNYSGFGFRLKFNLFTHITINEMLVQSPDVEVQSLVYKRMLLCVLWVQRVVLSILVYQVSEDGAAI